MYMYSTHGAHSAHYDVSVNTIRKVLGISTHCVVQTLVQTTPPWRSIDYLWSLLLAKACTCISLKRCCLGVSDAKMTKLRSLQDSISCKSPPSDIYEAIICSILYSDFSLPKTLLITIEDKLFIQAWLSFSWE